MTRMWQNFSISLQNTKGFEKLKEVGGEEWFCFLWRESRKGLPGTRTVCMGWWVGIQSRSEVKSTKAGFQSWGRGGEHEDMAVVSLGVKGTQATLEVRGQGDFF